MDSYTRLINVLKSGIFEKYIYTNYQEYINKLSQELKKPEVFMKFCRAFIMDMYFQYDDEEREKLVKKIEHKGLTKAEVEFLVFRLNACVAKPSDHINKDSEEFFKKLEVYKDTAFTKELSKYSKEIFNLLSYEMGVYTIEQIRDGDYHIPQREPDGSLGEYFLSDKEIKTLENAHKTSLLVDLGHSLYDDIEYIERPTILDEIEVEKQIVCDYEEAENDGLGIIVFNTLKDAPTTEIDIIFEDGTMMQYHKGSIRKKPYTIDEIMAYIYADIARIIEERGYNEKNISTIKPNELEMIIDKACLEITAQSDFLSEIYSKKMIDKAKLFVKRLTKIAQDENL